MAVYMLLNFENKILNHEIDIMDRFWNGKTKFSIVSATWMVTFGFVSFKMNIFKIYSFQFVQVLYCFLFIYLIIS